MALQNRPGLVDEFRYQGEYYRKSTEAKNQKLAERIHEKIRGKMTEAEWFDGASG